MGGLEGWSAGTRGMDVALLWRAAARKRVECACVRIGHVDRRFDTPAVFRDYRAAWVPVGDRVRRNGAVEIARPELHAANDSGAPGLEESKGHCKCVAVSDQAIASGRDRYCISFPTWVVCFSFYRQYIASRWQPLCDLSSARERRVRKGDCGGDVVSEGLLHATRTSAQLPRGTAVAGENDAGGCQQTPVA